jgi:probable addiction module antidote protein
VEERNEDGLASDSSADSYSPSDAANRLSHALQKADTTKFMHALGRLVRARGVTAIARNAGLNRTALYHILSGDADPRLSTVVALLSALSLRMAVEPLLGDDANDPPTRR